MMKSSSTVIIYSLDGPTLTGDTIDEFHRDISIMMDQKPQHIVIDLSKLEFVDSAVVGIFVLVSKLIASKTKLHLCHYSDAISKVFQTNCLSAIMQLHDTLSDALTLFPNDDVKHYVHPETTV